MKNLVIFFLLILLVLNKTVVASDIFFDDPLNSQENIIMNKVHSTECEQAIDSIHALYLNDVVNLTLNCNPDIQINWSNVLIGSSNLGSARSAYLPTITTEADLERDILRVGSHTTQSSSLINSQTSTFVPSIGLSYLLYDFGGREASVEVTKQSLLAANYDYNSTLQSTIFNTVKAYYAYIASKALVDATKKTLESTKLSMDAARLKYKVGQAALIDQLQAETTYAQSKLAKIQAENQQIINKGILFQAIGLSADTDLKIANVTFKYNNSKGKSKENLKEMINYAKKYRPDLIATKYKSEKSKVSVDVEKAKNYPTISFNSTHQYTNYTSGVGTNQNNTSLIFSVKIPVFTGFDNTYKIKTAEENYNQQKITQRKTEIDVANDVWASYQNLQTANQNLIATQTLLKSALKAEEVAEGRYKTGVGNMLDLLTAQGNLSDARKQCIQAEYNWLTQKLDLLRAIGSLSKEKVVDESR